MILSAFHLWSRGVDLSTTLLYLLTTYLEMRPSLIILGLSSLALAQRQCFYPNGDRDPNGKPCGVDNGGSEHTHCCYDGHYCLDNGLCFAKSDLTMYRSSCTDSTFGSDKCGQICTGGTRGGGERRSLQLPWRDWFIC